MARTYADLCISVSDLTLMLLDPKRIQKCLLLGTGLWKVFDQNLEKLAEKGIRDSESIVVNHIAMNVVVRL